MGTLKPSTFVCVMILAVLGACASSLKTDHDLRATPEAFEQNFVESRIKYTDDSISNTKNSPDNVETSQQTKTNIVASTKKTTKAPSKKSSTNQKTNSGAKVNEPEIKKSLSTHWPITVGEKIKIALRWGLIEGGIVDLEVKEPKELDGRPMLHFHGEVRSSRVMNLIYKIDNTIDTWLDLNTMLPARQEIKQLESGRWGRRVMLFDSNKNEVKFYEHITKKNGDVQEKQKLDAMGEGSQDLFGAFYFYRFIHHLSEGFRFPIHDNSKNWSVDLKYIGNETLRVPAGTFNTRRYKVLLQLSGNLEPRGDVEVWLSDDEKRHLVRFNAKIRVGSVSGDLIEYTPGQKIALDLPVWSTPATVSSQTISSVK